MKARIRSQRRKLTRGVTLIEVMIVVVILGLIAGGVAVAVLPKLKEAQIKTTRTSAMELRRATETWRATHASDQCPTLEDLRKDKAVDSASKLSDAWDDPFKIVCEEDETVVTSFGHDKKEGTADDIHVPELATDRSDSMPLAKHAPIVHRALAPEDEDAVANMNSGRGPDRRRHHRPGERDAHRRIGAARGGAVEACRRGVERCRPRGLHSRHVDLEASSPRVRHREERGVDGGSRRTDAREAEGHRRKRSTSSREEAGVRPFPRS